MARSKQTARKNTSVETFVEVKVDVKKTARKAGSSLRRKETRRLKMGRIKPRVFEKLGENKNGE